MVKFTTLFFEAYGKIFYESVLHEGGYDMERINTFEDYLVTDLSLSLEEMNNLHIRMRIEIGADEVALELYEDLLEQAVKYSQFRAKWFLWSKEERGEQDGYRTSCHNALIAKFNILARYLKNKEYPVEWREVLGDENANPYVRKRIGDFACFMVFVESVNSR